MLLRKQGCSHRALLSEPLCQLSQEKPPSNIYSQLRGTKTAQVTIFCLLNALEVLTKERQAAQLSWATESDHSQKAAWALIGAALVHPALPHPMGFDSQQDPQSLQTSGLSCPDRRSLSGYPAPGTPHGQTRTVLATPVNILVHKGNCQKSKRSPVLDTSKLTVVPCWVSWWRYNCSTPLPNCTSYVESYWLLLFGAEQRDPTRASWRGGYKRERKTKGEA